MSPDHCTYTGAHYTPRLGIRKSKDVATHMIARPDYYTGQVGVSIKDELEKKSDGDPPEHGDLSLTLLHHSLEMHTLREAAIEASAAATKDNISIYCMMTRTSLRLPGGPHRQPRGQPRKRCKRRQPHPRGENNSDSRRAGNEPRYRPPPRRPCRQRRTTPTRYPRYRI
jgi:hypothetical protein